jgi:hypothetical protein
VFLHQYGKIAKLYIFILMFCHEDGGSMSLRKLSTIYQVIQRHVLQGFTVNLRENLKSHTIPCESGDHRINGLQFAGRHDSVCR